ncbi:MAG TPA: UDP-glucose/GDP-mannose dehydrogenase family protein [Myxococcota bacterium]|nr:UDP-glucose/GDP-mannose dehydrogenase family protein [Myxococcota bacterium]
MNISVIGTGYVGLVTGACFAEFGIRVTCVDKDAAKIARLEAGEIPIFEPGLEEIVRRNVQAGLLHFTTDAARAVENSLVIFIAVATPPSADGSTDLSYVDEVAHTIGSHLDGYKVVVTKSTVPVKTAERVRSKIAEAAAAAGREGVRCSVASNPEFLREGSAVEDFLRPDRVVIGAEDPEAIAILRDLYKPLNLIEVPFVVTNVATAELIKYASNAFLATKISFINEISALCEAVGADVHDVSRAMGLDGRIGRKFLHPGPGYGGSCFPKDTLSLVQFSREFGVEQRIVSATVAANAAQRERMVVKVEKMLGSVKGKTLGVLGLSFKPNTDDVRDSPAIWVVQELQRRGAHLRCFDPQAMDNAARELDGAVFCEDPYDTAKGCDALLFLTEWNQFRKLDLPLLKERLRQPVIVDMRNICEPAEMKRLGFRYTGVGR